MHGGELGLLGKGQVTFLDMSGVVVPKLPPSFHSPPRFQRGTVDPDGTPGTVGMFSLSAPSPISLEIRDKSQIENEFVYSPPSDKILRESEFIDDWEDNRHTPNWFKRAVRVYQVCGLSRPLSTDI